MADVELKPCPFCGENGDSFWRDEPNGDGGGYGIVWCLSCSAEVSSTYVGWTHNDNAQRELSVKQAIAAWNRRA